MIKKFEFFKKIEKERATQLNEKILKKLTKREIEVMGLLCEGHTNKEVASKLDLSIRTVETLPGENYGKD